MSHTLIAKALAASGVPQRERYTPKEVQLILGASIETIRRMLREGTLKGQRIRRNWIYIYHDDIANLLDKDTK
jgi:predicted site-specific integrase-resolvase